MHKALRSMKVQGADGQMRLVKRGDKLPEAKTWRNLRVFIERGWVTQSDGVEFDRRAYEMAPRKALLERLSKKLTPGPVKTSEPEPKAAPEAPGDAGEPVEGVEVEKLMELKKPELVEMAESKGLETKYLNKGDLAKAIFETE